MPLTTQEPTPWLEPGAGAHVDVALNMKRDQGDVRTMDDISQAAIASAAISAAITFKRLVDMLEPFAKVAAEQMAEEAKSKGKKS